MGIEEDLKPFQGLVGTDAINFFALLNCLLYHRFQLFQPQAGFGQNRFGS